MNSRIIEVSVIVATYNQAPLVTQLIKSVLAQSFENIEIIVVDDGSTDDTSEKLSRYLGSITYLKQSHQGRLAAWATGHHAARGAWQTFVSGEDLMPPQKIQRQVEQLLRQPKPGLAYFGGQIRPNEVTQIFSTNNLSDTTQLYARQIATDLFLMGGPLLHCQCIEQTGLFEAYSNPNDDWNPWQQIADAGYQLDSVDKEILCKEHLAIALRRLNQQQISAAQRHITEVVRLVPEILEEPKLFIDHLLNFSRQPEVSNPIVFAETVLENLPECAQQLKKLKSYIIANLVIDNAFQNYALGNMPQTVKDVLTGIWQDRSFGRNRGVISILGKSLVRTGKSRLGYSDNNQPHKSLESIVKEVQDALGQLITGIRLTKRGTNHHTYIIKCTGQPFILRITNPAILRQNIALNKQLQSNNVTVPTLVAHKIPPTDSTDSAWSVEEWVPGHPFVSQNMRQRDALNVAAELGKALKQLHQIEVEGFGSLLPAPMYSSFDQWIEGQIKNYSQFMTILPPSIRQQVEEAYQFLRTTYNGDGRLCHFDLHYSNLLVNNGHLAAIIDWEEGYSCDPAFDISVFYFWNTDEQILHTLLQAYAPANPDLFLQRVKAGVICRAASFLDDDTSGRAIDQQHLRDWSMKWLIDNSGKLRMEHNFGTRFI